MNPGSDPEVKAEIRETILKNVREANERRTRTSESDANLSEGDPEGSDRLRLVVPEPIPFPRWENLVRGGEDVPWMLLRESEVGNASYAVGGIATVAELECQQFGEANSTGVIVSPLHLLLGLFTLGLLERSSEHREVSLPAALVNRFGLDEPRLDTFRRSVLDGTEIERERKPGSVMVSDAVRSVFSEAMRLREVCSPDGRHCAARHLVTALLKWTASQSEEIELLSATGFDLGRGIRELKKNIRSYTQEDKQEAWAIELKSLDALLPQDASGKGAPALGREANEDELCLNIAVTSRALAATIRVGADGDFCLALKGRWGRGKTTLMNEVVKRLKEGNAGYEGVNFNVWKYPQRPEVWVYLYQRIVEAAHRGGVWHKVRMVFHQSLEAVGWGPLFAALISFQLAVLPALKVATWVTQSFGFFALVFFVFFAKNAGKFFRSVRLRYFTPTDHTDHLGLQAAIGKDLKNLLKVWVRLPGQPMPSWWCAVGLNALLVSISWTIFYRVIHQMPIDFHKWTIAPFAGWWATATCIALVVPWVLRAPPTGPKRVLLAVDDLDRCPADSMIHIIESIRLLLDDPVVNQRMQTVILFDESLLTEALEAKYAAKLRSIDQDKESPSAMEATIQRLVRGQLDKYFLLEFNLPPLTEEETQSYLETLLDWDERAARKREAEELQKREAAAAEDRRVKIQKLTYAANEDPDVISVANPDWERWDKYGYKGPTIAREGLVKEREPAKYSRIPGNNPDREQIVARKAEAAEELARLRAEPEPEAARVVPPRTPADELQQPLNRFTFLDSEREEIRSFFRSLPPGATSPRNIRSFLMRCQLAQFILTTAQREFDGTTLIRAVGRAYFGVGKEIPTGPEAEVASHVV